MTLTKMPKLRTRRAIKKYLDSAIVDWRAMRESGNSMAIYYVDAFQSVRMSIFGDTLGEDDE